MSGQQDSRAQLKPPENTTSVHIRRALSRSPHPYHRQRAEVPHATLQPSPNFPALTSPLRLSHSTDDERAGEGKAVYSRHASPGKSTESDSGTEADDEHFLKGLPAPKWRPHKGLRGFDSTISGTPSPLVSPSIVNGEGGGMTDYIKPFPTPTKQPHDEEIRKAALRFGLKTKAEIGRRCTEVVLLLVVGSLVVSSRDITPVMRSWKKEISCLILIIVSLTILYPFRLIVFLASGITARQRPSITVLATFDPAPLLYPPALTIFVSLILSVSNQAVVLPNIILSIASLPSELIPTIHSSETCNRLHWFLSCIPLFIHEKWQILMPIPTVRNVLAGDLPRETLVLLFPLHQTLCAILHYLTTTSLLRAELQLLSIALINLLLLSKSPQAVILKALLWIGGMGMLVTCTQVLRWVITLARVPRWRFRRAKRNEKHSVLMGSENFATSLLSAARAVFGVRSGGRDINDEEDDLLVSSTLRGSLRRKSDARNLNGITNEAISEQYTVSPIESALEDGIPSMIVNKARSFAPGRSRQRSNTLPNISLSDQRSKHSTPSGRRKRSASSTIQSFFSLTERQATIRKVLYAGYVYVCVFCIIFIGIRTYVARYALNGNEPVGWALGYLFGNLQWFRMKVITANMERWICLPARTLTSDLSSGRYGGAEHIRQSTVGTANVRLILCTYWIVIIILGLAVVFRLSAVYEVDTRRKVFHFMMVAMLLPSTYIDPAFCALSLSLVLAIFLLLDLFRASQLPPLSKPLAYFLTPYVDGRDLRGPVVISHIFLLIGCAIPLWLSLGTVSRSGAGPWQGWELATRDVSMVSGVICVGMGDAAASLIGRRYGRHKWFWAGGKSLEGSLAFTIAVAMALMAAKTWLKIGGWSDGSVDDGAIGDSWATMVLKATTAAMSASLTEAVLTAGNDNVIVPVVLWVAVKGLRI